MAAADEVLAIRCARDDWSVDFRKMWRYISIGIALLLVAPPGAAHHSGSMFDSQKTITLQGTVRLFQWTNPHCWIQLLVDSAGRPVEWSIEMGPTPVLYRNGWRSSTLTTGSKIVVIIHPVREGSSAGQFVSATAADGSALGRVHPSVSQ